ncbi:Oxidative stress response two-component system protein SSK1 [Candida viswanathii]|uniref:Oxidative stress response two-component system protein SSK1 n=1 Tax=Candida viswanathii TaxID=5486 RepID=A0A367YC91_9ASCO|nr:Oxidative stress response two-component system protein SSK1 [Candida viswanathii]
MTSSSAAPPTTTKTPGTGPAVTATTTIAGGAPTSNPAAAAAVAATSQATPALITTPQSKFKKGGGGHIGDSPIPKIEIDKKGKGRDEYSNSSLNSANSDIIPANLPPRRVWVRKANGNPTTIFACVNDIVDDLKSAVIAKYPNSIGRFDDAADLVIKIDLGNLKTPVSPSMNRVSNNNNRTYENQLVVLEPDQNVWHVLDHYYPNGMCMNEALIVDTLTFTPDSQAQPPTPISAVPNLHSHSNGGSIGGAGDRHLSMVGYNFNRAQGVKHPQPIQPNNPRMTNYKVYPMTRANHLGNNINKDRSVSPSALVSRNSPVSHKRSYSNPVYSPVSNFMQPQQLQQSQLQSQAQQQQGNNPLAVLLLPKNFSLANNTNNNNTHKTRLSEDGMAATINENSAQEDEGEEDQDEEEKEFAEKEDGKVEEDFDEQRRGNKSSKSKHKPAPLPLTKLSSNVNNNSNNSIAGTPKSSDSTTDKVLPSISVLVVEDNAINQAILGAFLRKRKIHYKIAKNGQEAIDKWKQGGYHLVLMDIQLPVKSGIEATKEIRHLEKLNKIGVFDKNELNNTKEVEDKDKLDNKVFRSPVIIVALTASSNSSIDKKNALTAGCNDYLTKPVNLVWLQNKITEWGCMQALIDFDGWKDKNRRLNKT